MEVLRKFNGLNFKTNGTSGMGARGAGIYSNDFALDLRASVKALSRLPFEREGLANPMRVERPGVHDEQRIKGGYPPTPRINALADIVDIPGTESWPGGAEIERPNLSGHWQGTFSYLTEEKALGSFSAALSEREIHDAAGPGASARPTFATVQGWRVGRDVRFLKRHVSESKKYIPIQYIGEINDGATEITGQWFSPGRSSGRFAMTRSKPPDDA